MRGRKGIAGSMLRMMLAWALLSGCADVSQERLRFFREDGNDLFRQGNYDTARQSYQAALSLEPGDADLLYNLGQCYERLGKLDQAEHSYDECLQHNPNHADCRHALVALLVRQKRSADAETVIQDWLAKSRSQAGPLTEDGYLFWQSGNVDRALTRYQQALDIEPRNPQTLAQMGQAYEERGRPEVALVLYERAIACGCKEPQIRQHLDLLRARGVGFPRPD